MTRNAALAASAGSLIALLLLAGSATARPADPTNGGVGYVRSETKVSRASVGGLTEHWELLRNTRRAGSALIGGEAVFVAGTFHGPGVAALDVASGETRWSWPGRGETGLAPVRSGPELIIADDADGVTALDRATGAPVWSAKVPGDHESLVAAFNRVFVATNTAIAVIKSPSGRVRRVIDTGEPSRLRVANGRILVTRPGAIESRRPEDGRLLWQHTLPEPGRDARPSTPVYSKGLVLVSSPDDAGEPTLYAFDARSGRLAWRQPLPAVADPGADGYPAPVADFGTVYAADGAGTVSAHARADGRLLWRARLGAKLVGDPVLTGGAVLFAATRAGDVRAISARSGAELWRRDLGSAAVASPTAGSEGVVVTLVDGRTVRFALGAPSQRVLDWVKVRGNDLIDLFPDGQVDMRRGAGERRVLSRGVAGADYTVGVDATLHNAQWGYGLFVRAALDDRGRLSGYSLQFDPGYNLSFIVRHWYNDVEYATPFASTHLGSNFDWGARHRTSVTIRGNEMWATVDGRQVLKVNDIEAAIARTERPNPFPSRASGGVGLRAWNTADVTFHSVTVTGA